MREGPAPLIRREDYTAPAFWIREVDLSFDLDGAKTLVASRLRIERNAAQPAQALRLHGEGLTLLRVMADGQSVSFKLGMVLLNSRTLIVCMCATVSVIVSRVYCQRANASNTLLQTRFNKLVQIPIQHLLCG